MRRVLQTLLHRGGRTVAVIGALGTAACGGGRALAPAGATPAADTARVVPPVDTVSKAPADTTKAPPVANVADSIARAALDSTRALAGRRDSAGKKIPRKAPPPDSRPCLLDTNDSPPETRVRIQRLPDSTSLMFVGGGFVGRCQGEKNVMRADSAEHYEASGILNLFGNVSYVEPEKMRVDAQHATYFRREERIFADGNVVATQLASGSTFRGPSIEYLRPLPGSRTSTKLIAPNRPTVQIIEKDSLGQPGPPVSVIANTMVDEGDSLLFAWGEVQISRTTILGESDSASFDKLSERARLVRSARITNRDPEQPFRLFGDTIDIYSKDRKLERVVALHNGNASNNEVVMLAERLDLRFVEQELEQAYASGKGRAKATTSAQQLEADSIAIRMPEQRVRVVKAVGMAVATGATDTLKIKSEDRDVLRGDTVTAWFDSTAVKGDTTQGTKIREIEAFGNASSLFQIASKDGPTAPPAINYVRGRIIHIVFDSGQVRDVTVDSTATGLYLEPLADSLSDSSKVKKPSPAVRPPAPLGSPEQTPSSHSPLAILSPVLESRRRP